MEYDSREEPKCPCGGDLFLVDNESDDLLIWGECEKCGRAGKKFKNLDDAYEDLYTWS